MGIENLEYDPKRGLFLPHALRKDRYRAGPNPTNPPPRDPLWDHELGRIGQRVGRTFRWYWMKENHIWGIQMYRGGDNWQTVFCVYDENGQWANNQTPFKQIDARDLEDFCKADLGFSYGDMGLAGMRERNRLKDEEQAKDKAAATRKRKQMLGAILSGGDEKRMERLLTHEAAGGGLKFTEYFQVSRATPLPRRKKVTPKKVKK